MNVSLYKGFGCARFKPVFDRSISWPLLSTRASLTYVSGGFVSFPPPPRKWDPLIISIDNRPVVPLHAKPIRISATLPPFILLPYGGTVCDAQVGTHAVGDAYDWTDCWDPVESLRVKLLVVPQSCTLNVTFISNIYYLIKRRQSGKRNIDKLPKKTVVVVTLTRV